MIDPNSTFDFSDHFKLGVEMHPMSEMARSISVVTQQKYSFIPEKFTERNISLSEDAVRTLLDKALTNSLFNQSVTVQTFENSFENIDLDILKSQFNEIALKMAAVSLKADLEAVNAFMPIADQFHLFSDISEVDLGEAFTFDELEKIRGDLLRMLERKFSCEMNPIQPVMYGFELINPKRLSCICCD